MQDLSDDERRQILGEVLMDEFKAIREYLEDIPDIKRDVHQIKATVGEVNDRLAVIEGVVRAHEEDIRRLKKKVA